MVLDQYFQELIVAMDDETYPYREHNNNNNNEQEEEVQKLVHDYEKSFKEFRYLMKLKTK